MRAKQAKCMLRSGGPIQSLVAGSPTSAYVAQSNFLYLRHKFDLQSTQFTNVSISDVGFTAEIPLWTRFLDSEAVVQTLIQTWARCTIQRWCRVPKVHERKQEVESLTGAPRQIPWVQHFVGGRWFRKEVTSHYHDRQEGSLHCEFGSEICLPRQGGWDQENRV